MGAELRKPRSVPETVRLRPEVSYNDIRAGVRAEHLAPSVRTQKREKGHSKPPTRWETETMVRELGLEPDFGVVSVCATLFFGALEVGPYEQPLLRWSSYPKNTVWKACQNFRRNGVWRGGIVEIGDSSKDGEAFIDLCLRAMAGANLVWLE
jgi:hypothetical protein